MSGDEGGEGGEQIVAVVGSYLEHDGFAEVEAEYAEDGLGVHHIPAALEGHLVVVAGGYVDELLDGLCHVEANGNGFHGSSSRFLKIIA